ncbi:MAG: dihydrolipoyl dehydrogenase [Chloroflexota bacterium]
MASKSIVVIGGGPAGYTAALRAARLSGKVTLVEASKLGGTCLNTGCIPTKFLLHTAELYQSIKTAERYGIKTEKVNVDFARMQERKKLAISTLTAGITSLLKESRVEVIKGRARLTPSKQVEIERTGEKKLTLKPDGIILATGARAVTLPVPGAESPDIVGAESLLELERFPASVVIIGGGVIGVEVATILARLGSQVSIVEIMPRVIPSFDAEIAGLLSDGLRKEGITVYCGAKVSLIEGSPGNKQVSFLTGGETRELKAEVVATAVGRKPNLENLGLQECGIEVQRNGTKVDERMQTSVPGIYAAGDVTGKTMLAHAAFMEGIVAAENAMGKEAQMDYSAVPQAIFTSPEVAAVGLTQEEATARGYETKTGRFPFAANSLATVLSERRGIVKIIADRKSDKILGVHIAGAGASALIAEATLAVRLGLTTKEIGKTMHVHPTLSEALWEAALDASGDSIHKSEPR